MTTTREYGWLVEKVNRYGTEHLTCRAMVRETIDGVRAEHPINPRQIESTIWDAPKRLHGYALGDLEIDAHVYDGSQGPEICGPFVKFRQPYTVDLAEAKGMVKTLGRIARQRQKDESYSDFGDTLESASKALGFTFVVRKNNPYPITSSSYSDHLWHWDTVAIGRTIVRQIAHDMVEAAKALKAA